MDRAGSGGLITGKDVAMGQVGRHAGVGGFLGPVPPSKPILSRAQEDCPWALYFGVGGGVFNETRVARTRWDKRENILKKRRNIAPGLPKMAGQPHCFLPLPGENGGVSGARQNGLICC